MIQLIDGKTYTRDSDTLDTFVESSWYLQDLLLTNLKTKFLTMS